MIHWLVWIQKISSEYVNNFDLFVAPTQNEQLNVAGHISHLLEEFCESETDARRKRCWV